MILYPNIFKPHRVDSQAARKIGIDLALFGRDETEACRRKNLDAFDEELCSVLVIDLGAFDG